METETAMNSVKKKSCWNSEIWQDDHCVQVWVCICLITLVIWPICLGLAFYFIDDSNLTSSSNAICVNIDADQRCCSYANDEQTDCDGYYYQYQWLVLDGFDNDQCENVTFTSGSFCYTSKRKQSEDGPGYILGENATWFHDETCDDWSTYTPEENENIGMYLIYICIAAAVIYIITTYVSWKLCFGDIGES